MLKRTVCNFERWGSRWSGYGDNRRKSITAKRQTATNLERYVGWEVVTTLQVSYKWEKLVLNTFLDLRLENSVSERVLVMLKSIYLKIWWIKVYWVAVVKFGVNDADGYSEVHGHDNNKIWIVMIFGQRKWSVHRRLCRNWNLATCCLSPMNVAIPFQLFFLLAYITVPMFLKNPVSFQLFLG